MFLNIRKQKTKLMRAAAGKIISSSIFIGIPLCFIKTAIVEIAQKRVIHLITTTA